jgi:hypothetical protein
MNQKVYGLRETATSAVSTRGGASWTLPAIDNQEIIVKISDFIHFLTTSRYL